MLEGIQYCPICKKNKESVTSIKTYNGTFTKSCKPCEEEMKMTLKCMEITALWKIARGKFKTWQTSYNKFVLSPCK